MPEPLKIEAADLDAFADEITRQIASGAFAGAFVVERDLVAALVMEWAKGRFNGETDGCRVMCPSPCVVLTRKRADL